jgi:hypothetical protein
MVHAAGDITDRDGFEERLDLAEQDASRSRQVLHDIQIPLETIRNLSYLASHYSAHPEEVRAYLEGIDAQVEKVGSLIRNSSLRHKGPAQ